ncbi:MAG: hypothetical protein R3Y53_05010 [Bacillota bacterium]
MKLNQAISQRVTDILSERNLTQYQLFKISGVPRSTIGNIAPQLNIAQNDYFIGRPYIWWTSFLWDDLWCIIL